MNEKPYSILHISDLHRSDDSSLSNAELLSSLVQDRERYVRENPVIMPPSAIVVSGDLIQGVCLSEGNPSEEIIRQYDLAEELLGDLAQEFLGGDRSQLVIVPGNHDVDWNVAREAMTPVDEDQIPARLEAVLHQEDSNFRWDWSTRTLYRITDPECYEKRMDAYWNFFEKFYQGFPDLSTRQRSRDFRMAVWHHSLDGPPYRADYMNIDTVHTMIGLGFRLGLYGHQHRTQANPCEIRLPDKESMAVVSAGSLSAEDAELPRNASRQYNLLEISPDLRTVRIHVREMRVANLFSRAYLSQFGGKSYEEMQMEPLRNTAGAPVNTEVQSIDMRTSEAEMAIRDGAPEKAIELLDVLALLPGSYDRDLFLQAAKEAKSWSNIIRVIDSPTTVDELLLLYEAFSSSGDFEAALRILDSFSQQLKLSEEMENNLRSRVSALKVIRS